MPTTFTSYWGSALHGVEIKWTNDITANPVKLSFEYTSNYYWRMPCWYDDGVASDKALVAAIGSNFCVDISGTADDSYYSTKDEFNFQFFIAHPTTANLFDGFSGIGISNVKQKDAANGNKCSVTVEWKNGINYDIKPSADYDTTADA